MTVREKLMQEFEAAIEAVYGDVLQKKKKLKKVFTKFNNDVIIYM